RGIRRDAQPGAAIPRGGQGQTRRHVREGAAVSVDLPIVLPALLDALNRAHVGFAIVRIRDGSMEKVYANASLLASLGYTAEEFLAAPLLQTIAPDQRETITHLLQRLASGAPGTAAVEVRLAHRDGHEILAEAAAGRVEHD